MFGTKPVKETVVTAAKIEKAIGSGMRDLADIAKQKIAENIVGTVRAKKIRSTISEADLRTIVNIAEMSIDQALTTVGARVNRMAKDVVE